MAELFPDHPAVLSAARPRLRYGRFWVHLRQRRAKVATSSGALHHKSVAERQEATSELRAEYHNLIVRGHYEYERIKADREQEARQRSETELMMKSLIMDVADKVVDSAMSRGVVRDFTGPAVRFKVPSPAEAAASVLKHPGKLRQIRKASGEVEVSEKTKEHIKAIAAALVDDMIPEIKDAVAADPRIQMRCIMPRRQLEKEILRKYQKEMSEKRKEKLSVYSFVTKTTLSGLSSRAYAAVRSAIKNMGGRGVLPTVQALRAAKKELEDMSIQDMGVYETPDGWFVSARAVVENEILRIMQVVDDGKGTRHEAGGRVVGIGPDGHGWQNLFDVKIQLDARRITRRTSQTEVMLLIIPKGQAGVDRCQKALFQRTVGIWTGKDSRDNVQANMRTFFEEIECLQTNGVVFCPTTDSGMLAGIWQDTAAKNIVEGTEEWTRRKLRRVKLNFWLGADMAATCAVLGHGCAGNEYCGHCTAHKNERHIPYVLMLADEAVSFQRLAEKHDMFPSTLYAINACLEGQGGETEHGLRSCTADTAFEEDASAAEDGSGGSKDAATEGDGGSADGGLHLRGAGRTRRARPQRRTVLSACKGPDVSKLKALTGWMEDHLIDCDCVKCAVPVGTVVRVIPRQPEDGWRKSDWLSEVWPSHDRNKFPFCALHCLMRITEAMFLMITQRCLKSDGPVIDRLNAGLTKAGICKQLSKVPGVTGVHTYEKLTFEGHQALKLLAEDGGKMAVTRILESMWPTGDADGDGGQKYVSRVTALWAQWSKVVNLMKERDPEKVRSQQGFARFGKECREFCRLYQAMYHEQHCRSFYLHVLMDHAGDFMRELEKHGMCLGMMSNSGVERRHEYGRRAAKKAQTGYCNRRRCADLAGKQNLLAYLTLKEVLIWEHGMDIVSHELALKSERPAQRKGGRASDLHGADDSEEAYWTETLDDAKRAMETAEMSDEPMTDLSEDETVREGRDETERVKELFLGRDELCGVLEQESVAGSDEFEDEDADVMARRIRDLEDLRGDWLPDVEDIGDDDFKWTADDDSESEDAGEDFSDPGAQQRPGPSIALSRGRRTGPPQGAGRAGPTTSTFADVVQQQPAAASVPAASAAGGGQPRPQAAAPPPAASDPPGPGVPRRSSSQWTFQQLESLKLAALKALCKEWNLRNHPQKKRALVEFLAKHRPAT